jgi:hypothetical protein
MKDTKEAFSDGLNTNPFKNHQIKKRLIERDQKGF